MVASTRQLRVPEVLIAAFESFVRRETALEDLHALVAEIVSAEPAYVESIQSMFDSELERERISIADYGELVVELGEVLSEDVPTDCSALNPDESGVYRVVAPGQMVPDTTDVQPLLDAEPASPQANMSPADAGATPEPEPLSEDPAAAAGEIEPEAKVQLGPGTIIRGRFRLEEVLGSGSMGVVYRATDVRLEASGVAHSELALKVISPELAGHPAALLALQNEIVASQRLSHPHIVHVHDFDRDGEISFVTMELLEGQTLDRLLDEHGEQPLDQELADKITSQLGDALAYAHRQGVVHADLKPGNVFLCGSGEIKLIDFGLAQLGHVLRNDDDLLKGVLTPAYASCERLEHRKPNPQDDIYSFACLVYRMLVGKRPFGNLSALAAESRQVKLLPNAAIPRHRFHVLRSALEFRVGNRIATADAFVDMYLAPDPLIAASEPPVLTDKPIAADDHAGDSVAPDAEIARTERLSEHASESQHKPAPVAQQPDVAADQRPPPVVDVSTPESQTQDSAVAEETERKPFLRSQQHADGLAEQPEMTARFVARDLQSPENRMRRWRRKTTLLMRSVGYQITANQSRFGLLVLFCGLVAAAVVTVSLEPSEFSQEIQEAQSVASVPPSYPLVVLPTDESMLVIPADFYATQPVAASRRRTAVPAASPRPAPQRGTITVIAEPAAGPTAVAETSPEPIIAPPPVAEVAVGGVATQVGAYSSPVSVVTEVDPSIGQMAFVTEVATEIIPRDAEQDFVTNIASDIAAEGLSSVLTTVNNSAPLTGQTVGRKLPNPDEPLPLSELEFSRYVEPEFPALRGQDEGWVDVSFTVDERGRTANVEVADSSLSRRFNRSAINAVKRWRFEPYMRNGRPATVESGVRLRVE